MGNIGTRYATANGFYLSVVSALLAILTYASKDATLSHLAIAVNILVPAFGCVVCWIWRKTIRFYGTLFHAKFDVLRELETQLPFDAYKRELDLLVKSKTEWLTTNEARVPMALIILFALQALASLLIVYCSR